MKKFLLSLAVAFSAFALNAAPVSVDFTTATTLPSAEATGQSFTVDGINFTGDYCKQGQYQNKSYLAIQGKNNTGANLGFTLSFACENITVHTGSSASTNVIVQLTANGTNVGEAIKLNAQDADFSFSIPAELQAAGTAYKFSITNKYNAQFTKLTFNSDNGPITPDEPTVANVANIEEYIAKSVDDKVKFTSPVTAIYQNGNYLYIQDNTGNALVYGKLNNTYENGMTIAAGFEGTVAEYNGLKQLIPVDNTFAAGVAGTAIAPEAYAIEEISADMAHAYVSFEGVSIAAIEGSDRNFTMTDETGSITLYQQWSNVEIPVGENLNVVGFVGAYKGTAQILAVSITSASGKEIVAAPTFSPNGGAVLAGTEVTIASATEGATIYYTTDGTEPTTASTVYTEAIVVNEALTLKAIAVKEGLDNSAVATAEFTIKEPTAVSGNTATFNFTDPSTLDPAYSLADSEPDGTTGNNKIDLANGDLFTANGITISTNATGNPTRLYCQKAETDKTWSFRFFKNSVVTVSCQQGYKLTSIEFEPQTTNYASILSGTCTFSTGTLADNVLTFGTEATVTSVDITNPSNGATCGLKTMTVTFTEVNGISDVEIDENAPVEFFNLQGVRVNGDLTPGLYIRRQGNNATKVIVK